MKSAITKSLTLALALTLGALPASPLLAKDNGTARALSSGDRYPPQRYVFIPPMTNPAASPVTFDPAGAPAGSSVLAYGCGDPDAIAIPQQICPSMKPDDKRPITGVGTFKPTTYRR